MQEFVAASPQARVFDNVSRCLSHLAAAAEYSDMSTGTLAEKRERRARMQSFILNLYLASLWLEDDVYDLRSIDAMVAYTAFAGNVSAMHHGVRYPKTSRFEVMLVHPTAISNLLDTTRAHLMDVRAAACTP